MLLQINDLEKLWEDVEKRLQLVIGFTCCYCIMRTVIVCNLLKSSSQSNMFCTFVK